MSLYFTLLIALCTRMYPYVTRLSLVVPVWCSSHDRFFFFSVEPKGHGCARNTCSAFEYACLYADFCNFTVTTTRRKSPPLVALIALINVHFFPSLFFSLAFSENTLAYKERVIRIHFDSRIFLVCLSRRGIYASNQIAGIFNCYDHD